MTRPARLYKYQPPSIVALTNLSSGQLWFSNPAGFNDPFDCALEPTITEASDADCQLLVEKLASTPEIRRMLARYPVDAVRKQASASARAGLKKALGATQGVCCFSEIVDSLLMWGHYADSHRGFCLEFDTAGELFKRIKQVQYSDSLPTLTVGDILADQPEAVLVSLLTKATHWQYEKEWRALHVEADTLYGYPRSSLTGVYFGTKMPEAQQALIGTLLTRTDTKLYRMRLSSSQFKVEAEAVNFTPLDYRSSKSSR